MDLLEEYKKYIRSNPNPGDPQSSANPINPINPRWKTVEPVRFKAYVNINRNNYTIILPDSYRIQLNNFMVLKENFKTKYGRKIDNRWLSEVYQSMPSDYWGEIVYDGDRKKNVTEAIIIPERFYDITGKGAHMHIKKSIFTGDEEDITFNTFAYIYDMRGYRNFRKEIREAEEGMEV